MKIGEFFVELGAKVNNASVREFGKELLDMPLKGAIAIGALAKIQYELIQVAQAALDAAVGFQMFNSQTGLSSKELQRWQLVAEQANVSGQAVSASIVGLQRNIAEIAMGRGNISPFQLLGIDPRQDAFAVLDQVRNRIRGLDRATAVNLMTQMGIDASMIQLLALTNDEFKTLESTIVGMTSSQQASFLKTKQGLVQLNQSFKALAYVVLEVVAPILQLLVGWFVRLFSAARDFVSGLDSIPKKLAAIGLALAPLMIYSLPLTAALAALLLVLDDFSVYGRGGKSITGLAVDGLKKLKEELSSGGLQALSGFGNSFLRYPLSTMMGNIQPAGYITTAQQQKLAQTNHVNINVQTTADAEETARQTKSKFDQATSDAGLEVNNGGF